MSGSKYPYHLSMSGVYTVPGLVTTSGSVVMVDTNEKPQAPRLTDSRGNDVWIVDGKFVIRTKDGTEYTIPDDIEQLKEKIANLERVFNERFVFNGDEEVIR